MGRSRTRLRLAGVAAAATLACAAGVALANGAPAPVWGSPVANADQHPPPSAVTCVSATACVGVDASGDAFSSATPASGGWSSAIAATNPLNAVSCAPGGGCVAVGQSGQVATAPAPTGPWTALPPGVDSSRNLLGVSCPSASLCVAVDGSGNEVTSTNGGASWSSPNALDSGHALNGISCPTTSFCAAVDGAGNVLVSSTPTVGSWKLTALTTGALEAVSCGSSSLCVAASAGGSVFASANASAATPTWSSTALDAAGAPLTAVSCTANGLCAVVDSRGLAFTSDNAAGGPPAWTGATIDGTRTLEGVACVVDGLCLAVDQTGAAIAGLDPAPAVTTGTASASSQTTATLTATIDPGDASLSSCQFNYGTTTAYGATVPCSAIPAGNGGAQAVSAQVSGLTAGTTYHFQITAASGVAVAAGADGSFATPAPIKASPSLSGTPAAGSTLTCKPNVTVPATVTIAYQWTSDTVAIAGATAPTYVIATADIGHHLACAVTVSGDGGSTIATSGFTAVPSQSGAKITESFAGTARDSSNAARAPVTCSPQAAARCDFTLTLTTRSAGKQMVIGRSSANVAKGATATLSVHLNAAGGKLLAQKRRLAVTLTIRGTVLGTLVATLQTDHFTFKAKGTAHAPRRRR